ncbi:MAG: helix-turn-helix transcriptional regulator [Candidatus Thorarchaeota archaeon]|nr:helix-turn-helix transcriptional regulator [Candidatus Thorarchaeota archaeon]
MSHYSELFGKGVRNRRNELNLTQENLAEKADIHRTYLADIERGKRNPSLVNILKIIFALDLSPSIFFSTYIPELNQNSDPNIDKTKNID